MFPSALFKPASGSTLVLVRALSNEGLLLLGRTRLNGLFIACPFNKFTLFSGVGKSQPPLLYELADVLFKRIRPVALAQLAVLPNLNDTSFAILDRISPSSFAVASVISLVIG